MAFVLPGAGTRRSRGRGGRGRAPMAEINVTPFVDVMLVLLIIFMVTAPLLTAGVPVDLPDARAKAVSGEANMVNLAITGEGRIFIDRSEVPAGQLADALAATCAGSSAAAPAVTLRADRGLQYAQVIAVMGELNAAGCNAISLVTTGSVGVQ